MRKELQTFIEDVDFVGNYADGNEPSKFEYMALKAVANLFGGNIPTNEILAEVYSELQCIEGGGK